MCEDGRWFPLAKQVALIAPPGLTNSVGSRRVWWIIDLLTAAHFPYASMRQLLTSVMMHTAGFGGDSGHTEADAAL